MFREQVRLQFFLNVDKVLAFLTSVGSAFQRREAAELKARSPNRSRVRGMNRWRRIAGRSFTEDTGCIAWH